jgi:hypothetical protein
LLPAKKSAYVLSSHRGRLAHIVSYPSFVVEFETKRHNAPDSTIQQA